MNPIERIFYFAKPHQKYLWGSMFFNLLYSVLNIFSIGTLLPLLGVLFGTVKKMDLSESPSWNGHLETYPTYIRDTVYYNIQLSMENEGASKVLAILCIVTAFAFFLRNIFRYMGALLLVNYRIGITRDLRTAVYDKFLALPVSFFSEQRKGDMMSRISNDIGGVESGIMGSLVDIINAPFMIISSLVTLFILSPGLTFFSLIVFPVMGWFISWIGKNLKRQVVKAQEELGSLFSLVDETLRSSKIIKIFNADKILREKFLYTTDKWQKHSISMAKRKELASPISEFLGSVTLLSITWYAGIQILEHQSMQPETFLVFIALFYQILDPAKKLSNAFSSIQGGMANLGRVTEILDYDLKVTETESPKSIKSLEEGVEFKNVGFFYEKGREILKDFSLRLPKGKTVALVGQSGSGKSTIANLLARFYDVTKGEILIDGTDIRDLKLRDYRALLGMVTQESVLFNDTIYQNILMGNPEATEEMVIQASEMANARGFIELSSEGFNTEIGDEGNKLSGGQKQRISIARAILKNPPIMILDEATSALDSESEKMVQEALENMMKNRTSLIIAHRLSTIKKADHIVVMEKGRIVEEGSHDELYKKNGTYRKLIDLQNFDM
ncbi:MAG: ABC transporter ATP-binding protein [Bergeyella sp.]|nr:ABC transporter ATP-binding protein [Bergeyella sp.]